MIQKNFIIVLNDNHMSISENVGGMSKYLAELRTADIYTGLKKGVTNALEKVPLVGDSMIEHIRRTKSSIKQLVVPGMFFEDMGITYLGPVPGHNIGLLCKAFKEARKINGPVLLHVMTKKGKGYEPAELKPDKFHGVGPFNPETGTLKQAADMGFTFNVGPECEFFLFHTDDDGMPTTVTHEQAGYMDLSPVDLGENARRDMVLTLEDMGFEIEASHHEAAPAQHEIDFKYDEAIATADNIMTFKLAVKTIAKRHGLFASFMPKPKYGINGSGMHINMSLEKDGKNIFFDENDQMQLSKEAYYFIGGIMEHVKGMTAITNPLVNSYKRLVPGYEAPIYIAWSATNRSPLIRIPAARGEGTRVELRCPDPSANPYLALAVCLAAGLDGIRKQIMPPAAVVKNVYEMRLDEKKAEGIEALPATLSEAVEELEKDEYILEVLGEHISRNYIAAKRTEWAEYTSQVTDWEIEQYLYKI